MTLEALIGRWKTEGWTKDDPPAMIDAVDTYEWLPGGGVLHRVDARVGDERVEGAEIIGWDPERECYLTRYFGTDGPAAYEATLREEDGALWEAIEEGSGWRPWMDITLTKGPG